MRTKVQKWGNSLAIRIPRPFAEELGVERDSEVHLSLEDAGIVIRPVIRAEWTLRELLARVREDNLHVETVWGAPVGREVW